MLFALKLVLVAASVLLASLASRRWGHAVAGTLAGLPVIAGPIMAFVLWQQPPEQGRAIALATLVCLPATILHLWTYAQLAMLGWRWPAGLAGANLAFVVVGWALSQASLPPLAMVAAALAAPPVGLLCMRRVVARAARAEQLPAAVQVPSAELAMRVLVAVAMAAAVMGGADVLPPWASGLLLAVPIAGNVLPCFTLPRYGAAATVALLAGFVKGLSGFAVFFAALYLGLPALGRGPALLTGVAAALVTARLAYWWTRRATPAAHAGPSPSGR
ncbi:MAG TPA: hypothetical protein VNO84_04865 [Burkholderiaceae bacterium]|nr:hypothetical protein [Burkholderiaceae bacterium]